MSHDVPKLPNEEQLWVFEQVKRGFSLELALDMLEEKRRLDERRNIESVPATTPNTQNSTEEALGSPKTRTRKSMFRKKSHKESHDSKWYHRGQFTAPSDDKGTEDVDNYVDVVDDDDTVEKSHEDDPGFSERSERKSIHEANTAIQKKAIFNFGVYKYFRHKNTQRRILQIDFSENVLRNIEKGNVNKTFEFSQVVGYESLEGVHFFIYFENNHEYEIDADSLDEKNKICRLLQMIVKQNTGVVGDFPGDDRSDPTSPALYTVLKEGELQKRSSARFLSWAKRWVKVRQGELSYYRLGEDRHAAQNIIPLDHTVTLAKSGLNTFSVTTRKRTFTFKLPDSNDLSPAALLKVREDWFRTLVQASGTEPAGPVKPPVVPTALNSTGPEHIDDDPEYAGVDELVWVAPAQSAAGETNAENGDISISDLLEKLQQEINQLRAAVSVDKVAEETMRRIKSVESTVFLLKENFSRKPQVPRSPCPPLPAKTAVEPAPEYYQTMPVDAGPGTDDTYTDLIDDPPVDYYAEVAESGRDSGAAAPATLPYIELDCRIEERDVGPPTRSDVRPPGSDVRPPGNDVGTTVRDVGATVRDVRPPGSDVGTTVRDVGPPGSDVGPPVNDDVPAVKEPMPVKPPRRKKSQNGESQPCPSVVPWLVPPAIPLPIPQKAADCGGDGGPTVSTTPGAEGSKAGVSGATEVLAEEKAAAEEISDAGKPGGDGVRKSTPLPPELEQDAGNKGDAGSGDSEQVPGSPIARDKPLIEVPTITTTQFDASPPVAPKASVGSVVLIEIDPEESGERKEPRASSIAERISLIRTAAGLDESGAAAQKPLPVVTAEPAPAGGRNSDLVNPLLVPGAAWSTIPAPPPIPSLGIPPPPPPPGARPLSMLAGIQLVINEHRSLQKLRPLHWDRLPNNAISKSIWKNAQDLSGSVDFKRLEEAFSVTETDAPSVIARQPQRKKKTMIDGKMSRNIEIFLSGFKVSATQLSAKLNTFDENDEDSLTPEQVIALRRLQPSTEEIEMYKSYKGDTTELELADQFLMSLSEIPHIGVRLDILTAKCDLPSQFDEFIPKIKSMRAATEALYRNEKLVRVLKYILVIGNYLNSSTNKQPAYGFHLSTLPKLADCRGRQRLSLTQFVTQEMHRVDPDALGFTDELALIEKVSTVSLKALVAEADVLRKDLTKIRKNVAALAKSSKKKQTPTTHASDANFCKHIDEFVGGYERKLASVNEDFATTKKTYEKVLHKFGESSNVDTNEVFSPICQFIAEVKKSINSLEKNKSGAVRRAVNRISMRGMPVQSLGDIMKKSMSARLKMMGTQSIFEPQSFSDSDDEEESKKMKKFMKNIIKEEPSVKSTSDVPRATEDTNTSIPDSQQTKVKTGSNSNLNTSAAMLEDPPSSSISTETVVQSTTDTNSEKRDAESSDVATEDNTHRGDKCETPPENVELVTDTNTDDNNGYMCMSITDDIAEYDTPIPIDQFVSGVKFQYINEAARTPALNVAVSADSIGDDVYDTPPLPVATTTPPVQCSPSPTWSPTGYPPTNATTDDRDHIRKGVLMKCSSSGGGVKPWHALIWDQRYFILTSNGFLHYMRHEGDSILGSIDVKRAKLSPNVGKDKTIAIDAGDRVYRLKFTCDAEGKEWIRDLHRFSN